MTSRLGTSSPYRLFLTAPSAPLIANSQRLPRQNLTLMASRDGGKSWQQERILDPDVSAYSDLEFASDGALLCLYEAGKGYKSINCMRLSQTKE